MTRVFRLGRVRFKIIWFVLFTCLSAEWVRSKLGTDSSSWFCEGSVLTERRSRNKQTHDKDLLGLRRIFLQFDPQPGEQLGLNPRCRETLLNVLIYRHGCFTTHRGKISTAGEIYIICCGRFQVPGLEMFCSASLSPHLWTPTRGETVSVSVTGINKEGAEITQGYTHLSCFGVFTHEGLVRNGQFRWKLVDVQDVDGDGDSAAEDWTVWGRKKKKKKG